MIFIKKLDSSIHACYNRSNYTNPVEIIVNHPNRPFRTNIGFIVNKDAGYLREMPYEIEEFNLDGDLEIRGLAGIITLTRARNGIHALGDFSGRTDSECGRCLEHFELMLHTEFEQIYTLENHPLSEDEETVPADGYIDFELLLHDYLLMEIPINPLCSSDCKGLCSICGQNLNEGICEHQEVNQQAALEFKESSHPEKTNLSG
jgi:uncharacterized protein